MLGRVLLCIVTVSAAASLHEESGIPCHKPNSTGFVEMVSCGKPCRLDFRLDQVDGLANFAPRLKCPAKCPVRAPCKDPQQALCISGYAAGEDCSITSLFCGSGGKPKHSDVWLETPCSSFDPLSKPVLHKGEWICAVCNVSFCKACNSSSTCERCQSFYTLAPGAEVCEPIITSVWNYLAYLYSFLVAWLLVYLVSLFFRPQRFATSGFSKIAWHYRFYRRAREGFPTWWKFWQWHTREPLGIGVRLFFNFVVFVIFMALTVGLLHLMNQKFNPQIDWFVRAEVDLGYQCQFGESQTGYWTAKVLTNETLWAEQTWPLFTINLTCYVWVLFAASVFAMYQSYIIRVSRENESDKSLTKYALYLEGLPMDLTRASTLEKHFEKLLQDEFGKDKEQLVGASISYKLSTTSTEELRDFIVHYSNSIDEAVKLDEAVNLGFTWQAAESANMADLGGDNSKLSCIFENVSCSGVLDGVWAGTDFSTVPARLSALRDPETSLLRDLEDRWSTPIEYADGNYLKGIRETLERNEVPEDVIKISTGKTMLFSEMSKKTGDELRSCFPISVEKVKDWARKLNALDCSGDAWIVFKTLETAECVARFFERASSARDQSSLFGRMLTGRRLLLSTFPARKNILPPNALEIESRQRNEMTPARVKRRMSIYSPMERLLFPGDDGKIIWQRKISGIAEFVGSYREGIAADDPMNYNWFNTGLHEQGLVARACKVARKFMKGMVILIIFFFPNFFYVLSHAKGDTQSGSGMFAQNGSAGILVAIGYIIMGATIFLSTPLLGCLTNELKDRINFNMVIIFSGTLLLINQTLAVTYLVDATVLNYELAQHKRPTDEYAGAIALYNIMFPGQLLMPHIMDPIFSVLVPLLVRRRICDSRSDVRFSQIEESLSFPPIDLVWPYAELILNMSLALSMFFRASNMGIHLMLIWSGIVFLRYLYLAMAYINFTTRRKYCTDTLFWSAFRFFQIPTGIIFAQTTYWGLRWWFGLMLPPLGLQGGPVFFENFQAHMILLLGTAAGFVWHGVMYQLLLHFELGSITIWVAHQFLRQMGLINEATFTKIEIDEAIPDEMRLATRWEVERYFNQAMKHVHLKDVVELANGYKINGDTYDLQLGTENITHRLLRQRVFQIGDIVKTASRIDSLGVPSQSLGIVSAINRADHSIEVDFIGIDGRKTITQKRLHYLRKQDEIKKMSWVINRLKDRWCKKKTGIEGNTEPLLQNSTTSLESGSAEGGGTSYQELQEEFGQFVGDHFNTNPWLVSVYNLLKEHRFKASCESSQNGFSFADLLSTPRRDQVFAELYEKLPKNLKEKLDQEEKTVWKGEIVKRARDWPPGTICSIQKD